MEFPMKMIMVSIVVSALLFTFGCNYDYGKYGKDKKDTEQKNTAGEASN